MADDIPPISAGRLARAASRLRADEHEALRLSAVLQLSSREIAERLGMSAVEAEALVASALVSLERALRREVRPWWRFL